MEKTKQFSVINYAYWHNIRRNATYSDVYVDIFSTLCYPLLRRQFNIRMAYMSKVKKKNFYAIYYRDSKKSFIVKTWPECQRVMRGHNNLMRGFFTETEAKEWLESLTDCKCKGMVTYCVRLKFDDAEQLQRRLDELHLSPATLIENLVLEYLYDA